MKTKTLYFLFSALIASFLFFNCSNTDELKEISGVVTIDGSGAADGAIVTLSSQPNAAEPVVKVVVGSDGKYAIANVEEGTYYLSAKYDSDNTNNMKSQGAGFVFMTASDIKVEMKGSNITQDIDLVSNGSSGTAVIDLEQGWKWDNTHSYVGFDFEYDEENAIFSGLFGEVDWDKFVFDEANPSNCKFEAKVSLISIETGSPSGGGLHGRDGVNGCLAGTFGINRNPADTNDLGEYNESAVVDPTGTATFKSTEVSAYGDGYLAKGTLGFNGLQSNVNLYFHYIEGYEGEDRFGVQTKYISFDGWFEFKAKEDHDIQSSHLGDEIVTVRTAIQFYKPME